MKLDTLRQNFINHKIKIAKDLFKFIDSNLEWQIEIASKSGENVIKRTEDAILLNNEQIDYYCLIDIIFDTISNSAPFYDISNKVIRFDIR